MAILISGLAAASAVALVVYGVVLVIYRIYFHPLSRFPGPWYLKISPLPNFYLNNVKGTWFKKIKELHDQHGDFVRIGPNHLSVDGGVGWKDVFGHKSGGRQEFGKNPKFFPPMEKEGSLILSNQQDHRRMRRLLAHAFSESALQAQEPVLKTYVDLLMDRMRQTNGQPTDMVKWYNCTTFDMIGDLAFGDPFNGLKDGIVPAWVQMVFTTIKTLAQLRLFTEYPSLTPLLPWVVSKESARKRMEHRNLTELKAIKRINAGSDHRVDFMTYILRHNDEKGMSRKEIVSSANLLIVAGSETTATLLSGLTYYLATTPRVYKKLTTSVREAFTSEDEINMVSASKLDYLFACLEEGLRIYPPAAETTGRISPGDSVNGEYLPKGTEITIHQYQTHHNARNFHSPESFIPERWLPETHPDYDPIFRNDNKASFQPFSFGPRNCLGRNLAYAEMRLIMARLLWNFDFELAGPEGEREGWPDRQKVFLVFEKAPLWCRLVPVKR